MSKDGFDKYGYYADGFNKEGNHKATGTKFNKEGYDKDGFSRNGYDKSGYDKDGIHIATGTLVNTSGLNKLSGFFKSPLIKKYLLKFVISIFLDNSFI